MGQPLVGREHGNQRPEQGSTCWITELEDSPLEPRTCLLRTPSIWGCELLQRQQNLLPEGRVGEERSVPVNPGPCMYHSCWEEQLAVRACVSTWVLVHVSE